MTKLGFALAVTMAALGCGKADAPALPAAEPAGPTIQWAVARAATPSQFGSVAAVVRASGDTQVAVTLACRAQVVHVLVQVGDRVVAGQPLAELRFAELGVPAARLRSLEGRIAAHSRWVSELRSLKGDGLVRGAELFEAEAQLAELRASRMETEAQIRAAGLELGNLAALEAGQTLVWRAPTAGLVRSVDVQTGATLEPGHALVQLVSAGLARIEVRSLAPLPRGATLQFTATHGLVVPLASAPTATSVDPSDGALLAWYLPQGQADLAGGTRGLVRVVALAGEVVEVPARAVFLADDPTAGAAAAPRAHVWTADGAGQRQTPVEVVHMTATTAWLRGLAVGQKVAAEADLLVVREPALPE